jgi:hypothetical protein
MKYVKDRYVNDPSFRNLVATLTSSIAMAEFSPTEIRQAAMQACINYEMTHLRPTIFKADNPELINALGVIRAHEERLLKPPERNN